jgi:hypothetical protein
MRIADWDQFWRRKQPRLLFGFLCLAGAVGLARVAVTAQKLDPWQDFWVVFFSSLFLIWAVVATFLAQERLRERVSSENIEARLNEWFLRFRFANQKLADSTNHRFAYRVTAPDGQVILIARPATLDNYLRYRTDLTILDRHRRLLNDLGENGRRRFMTEYMSECAKARVHITSARALPFTVRIERTVPIMCHLGAEDLWSALEAMQQDVIVALTQIDLCLERVRESPGTSLFESPASPSSTPPEAETWTHEKNA